jgi:O-antigen ligase
MWMWIAGSRSPSVWLSAGESNQTYDATLDGNSTDALILGALLAAGMIVLLRRKEQSGVLLKASWPISMYFGYCLLSVLWSPFPDVAFKRWIKALGDLVMVLVVLTDGEPIAALRRLFSWVGFILLPASIYLIRFSSLGRGFDEEGNAFNTGVTTNKNTLGLTAFVLALGAVWNLRALLRTRHQAERGRRLLAQGTLLAFGVAVLAEAHSATSIACFTAGTVVMTVTGLRWVRRRPSRLHMVMLTIAILAGIGTIFDLNAIVVQALGRKPDLTGRTDIWKTVIPMARNPIIGAGFESFWNASHATLKQFSGAEGLMYRDLNSAHNGYIEVYLELGWIGLCLIALILISGYRHAGIAFRYDPESAGLILAYMVAVAMYSLTEAGFRLRTPTWIFLILAVVFAGGISRGSLRTQSAPKPYQPPSCDDGQRLGWSDPLLIDR